DNSALRLILGVEWIDDLVADVAGNPDFFGFHFLFGVDVEQRDRSKVAAVREMESDAHARTFGQSFLAPLGFLGDESEDAAHAIGIELRSACGWGSGCV